MPLPKNLPEPRLTLTLARPVQIRGGQLSALELREPTVAEVWVAEGHLQATAGPEAQTMYLRELVAKVAGIKKPEDLDEVPISALAEAFEYLSHFIVAGLPKEKSGPKDDPDRLDELEELEDEEDAVQDETWELPLATPIKSGGLDYSSLTLSEPTTGAVRKAQGHLRRGAGPQALRSYQVWLVTHASGTPVDVVKQLPISTLNAAVVFLLGFSRRGRGTGRNSPTSSPNSGATLPTSAIG